MKTILDLNLEDFFRLILGYENVYRLVFSFYKKFNNMKKEEVIIEGTISEMLELAKELDYDKSQKVLDLCKDKPEYQNFYIDELEIYKYLEHHTKNFEKELVEMVLKKMDLLYFNYSEEMGNKLIEEYKKEKRELPTKTLKIANFDAFTCIDRNKMLCGRYPDEIYLFQKTIDLLEKKLKNNKITNTELLEYGYNDFIKLIADEEIDIKFISIYLKNEYDNNRINSFFIAVEKYIKTYYLKMLYAMVDKKLKGISFSKKEVDEIIRYQYLPIDYMEFNGWYSELLMFIARNVVQLWPKSNIALKLPNTNLSVLVNQLAEYVSNPRMELTYIKSLNTFPKQELISEQHRQLTKDLKTDVQKNPPPPKELTPEQIENLKKYFISQFKGIGNNTNDFENLLIPDLNNIIKRQKAKECAMIAAIIYDCRYFKSTNKPTFNNWRNEFYNIMGIKTHTIYKKSVLEKENKYNKLREKFNYLNI